MLGEFLLRHRDDGHVGAEQNGARGRGPLIERKQSGHETLPFFRYCETSDALRQERSAHPNNLGQR